MEALVVSVRLLTEDAVSVKEPEAEEVKALERAADAEADPEKVKALEGLEDIVADPVAMLTVGETE